MSEDLNLAPGDRVRLVSPFALDRNGMAGVIVSKYSSGRGTAARYNVLWDDGRSERGVLIDVLAKEEG